MTSAGPRNRVDVRSPDSEDAKEVAQLINSVTGDWLHWPRTTEQEVRDFWQSGGERQSLVARFSGQLIGYCRVYACNSTRLRLWFDVWTGRSPIGAELDRTLVRGVVERAAARSARAAADVVLSSNIDSRQSDLRSVLVESGYRLVGHPVRMLAQLAECPPKPVWPAGIRVRTFEAGDERTVYELHMATLADAGDFDRPTYEKWLEFTVHAPHFDPTLWFLAEVEGALVGIALCHRSEFDASLGWFDMLGVRRDWRGRGLGAALTHLLLGEYYNRGVQRVGCGTDGANPTNPRGVVGTAGFRVVQEFETYEKRIRRPHGAQVRRFSRRVAGALTRLRSLGTARDQR